MNMGNEKYTQYLKLKYEWKTYFADLGIDGNTLVLKWDLKVQLYACISLVQSTAGESDSKHIGLLVTSN